MGLLQPRDRKVVEREFKKLREPVKLIMFTQEMECQFCQHTRELMEEVASLSDKISVEVYDLMKDEAQAQKYNVDKIPATVVVGDRDYGMRFYGIPSGYEFVSLMEAIKSASAGSSHLTQDMRDFLKTLDKDVHFQVFVTPT